MAGDWIKVEKLTPDKPEIAILARKLGVSIGDAFLEWFRIYAWADGMTCPGFVPHLSLADVDQLARAMPRTSQHLASPEIGWLNARSDGIEFTNWERHNGKSAKARALDAEKKRKQRGKTGDADPPLSRECPAPEGTERCLEREESERKNPSLNSDRRANGSARAIGPDAYHPLPLPRRFVREEGQIIANLDGLDWEHVCGMADAIGKRIKPRTTDDRRQWLRFSVFAETAMSEDWLIGAADAVSKAKGTKRTKQAHFVGVLKAKAADSGWDSDTFNAMLGSIEIPNDVWKTSVLEIGK